MNRRAFTAGLTSVLALPALPIKAVASLLPPAATAIPNPARFWAIYLSHLHGSCTPAALAKATEIKTSMARGYLGHMLADGTLTPVNLVQHAMARHSAQSPTRPSRLKQFIDKKTRSLKSAPPDGDSSSVNQDLQNWADDTSCPAPECPAQDPNRNDRLDPSDTIKACGTCNLPPSAG